MGKQARRMRRRDPAKASFWQGLVREHAASGLSVRTFCREAGVAEASFYHWRRELRQREREGDAPCVCAVVASDTPVGPDAEGCADSSSAAEGHAHASQACAQSEPVGSSGAEAHSTPAPARFLDLGLAVPASPEVEVRRGEVCVILRGGCDAGWLRAAVSALADAPC